MEHRSRRLIDIGEVERMTGMKKSFIYHNVKAGTFPKNIKVGPKASRWDSSLVEAWVSARLR